MYLEVLVELKTKKIDKTFTYHSKYEVQVGSRVLVPFGYQKLEGFVLKVSNNKPEYDTKEIIEVIDKRPVLNKEMLKIGEFMAKTTIANLITCYQTMLPTALKAKHGTVINKKYIKYIKLIDKSYVAKNDIQKDIIDKLKNNKLVLKSELNPNSIKTLIKNNIVKEVLEESYRLNDLENKLDKKVKLNEEQKFIVDDINKIKEYKTCLIHGVTGSGKTEVYMNIIENTLKEKKEAIVLVPEISLTPQLVDVFKRRFGSLVAILHSGLNNGEKYDEWRKIERKEVSIVIGARSAIFAPFENLGLIIIDEEHSNTYKQDNNPRYSAIDIARYRGKLNNIPVVLGTATPSLETYTKALQGTYKLYELKNRINKSLPKTHLVDMKGEYKKGNTIISELLNNKIKERLDKKEQIILFLNRRGFTTKAVCPSCGYVHKCPACDIPYTYHKSIDKMKCHYCNRIEPVMTKCPECGNTNFNNYGIGTEKLEQLINEMYPSAKVIRMDNDTTSKKGAHSKIIESFRKKEYDILIGTQMISKGLDFESVTLVGVLNAEQSLNMPDFRSAERTFSLINQVSGRAGRGSLKGEVVVQGFNIDHYSIVKSSNNDYLGFYNKEMEIRKILKYSPYYNLCKIKISYKDYKTCNLEANKIASYLRNKTKENVIVLGPSPNIIPKINNIYILNVIIKYKNTRVLIDDLIYINNLYRLNKVNVDIELNPKIV